MTIKEELKFYKNISITLVILLTSSMIISGYFITNWAFQIETIDNPSVNYYKPLFTKEDSNWKFEHLWFGDSTYNVGIENDDYYVLKFNNYDQDINFKMIFGISYDYCSIEFFNASCKESGECFTKHEIRGG